MSFGLIYQKNNALDLYIEKRKTYFHKWTSECWIDGYMSYPRHNLLTFSHDNVFTFTLRQTTRK